MRRRSSEGVGPMFGVAHLAGMDIADSAKPMSGENSGQRSRSQSDLDSQDVHVRAALLEDELERARRELSGLGEEVNSSFKEWESRQGAGRFVSPPPSKIKRSPQSFDQSRRPTGSNPAKYKKGRSFDNIFEFTAGVGTESEKLQRAILKRSGSHSNMSEPPPPFDIQGQTNSRRSMGSAGTRSPAGASWSSSPDSWKGDSPGTPRVRYNPKSKTQAKWRCKQQIKENQEWKAIERTEGIDGDVEGVGGGGAGVEQPGVSPPQHPAVTVSQMQVKRRLKELERLAERAGEMRRVLGGGRRGLSHSSSSSSLPGSSSVSSEHSGARVPQPKSERKIKFSTDEFWIALRARVRGREQAEEKALVDAARGALDRNEPIDKIKRFSFGAGKGVRDGEVQAAVEEVEELLGELDSVVESACPCAYASGVKKHKLGEMGPYPTVQERPNSVAMLNPEFSCGGLEDRSTFVSNLEALRAWHAAAQAGLAAKAGLEKTAAEVEWDSPDLGGLLHRVPMREVTSLILARAKPALERLHTVYRGSEREALVTIIDARNDNGTPAKTSRRPQRIQQHSYAPQLSAMKLPDLASVGGLAGSLAMVPLRILLKIVASRVAQRPKQPLEIQRWWAGPVFQQRFEECIQLLQAGRDFQEELREHLPGVLDGDGGGEQGPGVLREWREVAEELESQLREVLLMALSLCSANNLEVAGCCGAKQLREACIDLRREEIPRVVESLSMFKDAGAAEKTAAGHCGVLELLLRKGRQLVEDTVEQSMLAGAGGRQEWAGEVEQAVSACWGAVRVARAGVGDLGLSAEMEAGEELEELLKALYDKDYVWVRGDRQAEGEEQQRRHGRKKREKERGRGEEGGEGGEGAEEAGMVLLFASPALFVEEDEALGLQRCAELLKASYKRDGGAHGDVDGHVLRLWVPDALWEHVRNTWQPSANGRNHGEEGSLTCVRLAGLAELMEAAPKGVAVLTAANSYTLEQELTNFCAKLPEAVISVRPGTRPNRQAVVAAVAKVTAQLEAVEGSMSAMVDAWTREWGLINEASPNAAWTKFPLTAPSTPENGAASSSPSIGMLEFTTLQRVFDLAVYTASALNTGVHSLAEGAARWNVARSWALARMAVVREEGKGAATGAEVADGEGAQGARSGERELKVTGERLRYMEEGLRGAVEVLDDGEWEWWVTYLEALHAEARAVEGGAADTEARAAKVLARGGTLAQRRVKVAELEAKLAKKWKEWMGIREVQEEQRHAKRMVLTDEQGQRLHWIKLGKLGQGSFGDVYRAQFWQSMDFVAVKEIRDVGKKDDNAKKVELETRVMAKLKHSNVVRYYGMETAEGRTGRRYMFIEYCAEGHLRDFVKSWMANASWRKNEGSVVPLKIVRNYTMQLAWGLQHMHQRGVLHRDIKALNILLADNGNVVKISDFGEAIEKPPDKTWPDVAPANASGTIGHQAPELLQSGRSGGKDAADFGPKIDVWSLACVVTEMLTGALPETLLWEGPAGRGRNREGLNPTTCYFLAHRLADENPEALVLPYRQFLQALPEDVTAFLDRCFVVSPPLRPSASEILNDPFLLRR